MTTFNTTTLEQSVVDAFFCGDIGTSNKRLACCYNHPIEDCDVGVWGRPGFFDRGCNSGNCINDCRNISYIFNYNFVSDSDGVNEGAIAPWTACLNVPNVASLHKQGALAPNISSRVEQFIPLDTTAAELKNITESVTRCLTASCFSARNSEVCAEACAPINLLINATTPNYVGVNDCMYSMCTAGYDAVPFANADIVGIGVFSSYVMQCCIILILWLFFLLFSLMLMPSSHSFFFKRETIRKQRDALVTGLVEFHKTQCFFSGTIQIAALSFGLFTTDFLTVFMVIPLAINGIIPVVFAHLLVLRFGHGSVYLTMLTSVTWFLSTLVFWILYSQVGKVNWDVANYDVYQDIMYSLAKNEQCGGFSALTACPENMILGLKPVTSTAKRVRYESPILWAWGTLVFFILLGYQIFRWLVKRNMAGKWSSKAQEFHRRRRQDRLSMRSSILRSLLSGTGIFWTTTVLFVMAIGSQIALLYTQAKMEFFDQHDWTFGQIVAITIWIPPLFEYVWVLLKGAEKAAEAHMAKNIKVEKDTPNDGGVERHVSFRRKDAQHPDELLPVANQRNGDVGSHVRHDSDAEQKMDTLHPNLDQSS